MANIAEFLQKILSARYGEEVRKSIHDAIKEIDNVADGARDSATNAASQAQEHARKAEESAEKAKEAATKAEDISAEITDVKQQVQTVVEKTQEAVEAAGTATAKADETLLSAQLAAGEAQDAKNAAMSANNSAQNASASETNARNSEENAGDYWRISKSYAVGDAGEREGEDNDNSKYYCEQSAEHARRAEEAAEKAISISDISIATNDKAGLVKPDGETIRIDEDGTIHAYADTVNYIELENKPKINGVELSGDKSFEELGFEGTKDYSVLENKPTINGIELDGDKTLEELGFEGTKDYSVLENKPTINGTELNGDKTLEELGIASAEELDKTNVKVNTIIEKADLGIKETASGENIHLTDSADGKAVEIALYGKATQDGEPTPENPVDIVVSGESYNLLENTATSQTVNGVTFTVNEDKSVTLNSKATGLANLNVISGGKIPLLKNGEKYLLSGCTGGNGSTYEIYIYKVDVGYVARNYNGDTEFIYDSSATYNVGFVVREGVTVNNLTFYPMIRKASVKNDRYMPYGKGSVEVKSVGKNLLKFPYYDVRNKELSGVKCVVNLDNSITVSGTNTNSGMISFNFAYRDKYIAELKNKDIKVSLKGNFNDLFYGVFIIFDKDGNTLHRTNFRTSNIGDVNIKVPDNADNYNFQVYVSSGVMVNTTIYPMISLEGGEYEPYQETKPTIPTDGLAGIPVSSGGNYTDQSGQQRICDEIVKYADGSGESIKRFEKAVLDASNVDNLYAVTSTNGYRIKTEILKNVIKKAKDNNEIVNLLCSQFVKASANGTYLGYDGISVDTSGNLYIYSSKYNTSDISLFKSHLTNNPMILYYELAEPIRTPLTAEQIAEIEKVSTFYPVTNISNDFDCGMRVKYLADSKNYIDNQLALQAQAREQEMMAMFMLLPEETQAAMIENDINNLLLESEV